MKWSELTPEQRDTLIAEKVMGWKQAMPYEVYQRYLWEREDAPGITRETPPFSRSMDAAWQVVRRMNNPNSPAFPDYQEYANFIAELVKLVGSDMFFDLFYCDHEEDHLTPARLCIAALRAVGMEIDL